MAQMIVRTLSAALIVVGLAGCSATHVGSHPLIEQDTGQSHATVYFIRPYTERTMGFADNALQVEVNQARLLTIDKGEYTALHLKPLSTELVMRNVSPVGPWSTATAMEHRQTFDFKAGQTYFLVITPVDGEFRGVYFVSEAVDRHQAQRAAQGLHARGGARAAPL